MLPNKTLLGFTVSNPRFHGGSSSVSRKNLLGFTDPTPRFHGCGCYREFPSSYPCTAALSTPRFHGPRFAQLFGTVFEGLANSSCRRLQMQTVRRHVPRRECFNPLKVSTAADTHPATRFLILTEAAAAALQRFFNLVTAPQLL